MKYNNKFAHYKMKVFEIPNHELKPGSYAVSFQFTLPHGIPSSIAYKESHSHERAKAKVKYWVKAIVDGIKKDDDMKYKQVLAIREKPVEFKANEQKQETANIKTWCCIDQGASSMWSTFDKNIYTPQETAKALVHVDNSACKLPVTHVKFFVE